MKRIALLSFVLALLLTFGAQANSYAADARAQFDAVMNDVLAEYLKITDALAADRTDGVTAAAKKIQTLAGMLDADGVTGEVANPYRMIADRLAHAAAELAQAGDIATMRTALKKLSQPMAMWQHHARSTGVNTVYCSMYQGSWLQNGNDIRNPYYGSSMLTCGEIVGGPDQGQADGHMQNGHH
ncbi:MAG: DUF3347 domain-containing protein [Alphaproteobacteria bacterium]